MVGTADRSAFTIAQAKRTRIAESKRKSDSSGRNQVKKWLRLVGKYECLMPSLEVKDGETLDLTVFTYDDFLEFLTWIVSIRISVMLVILVVSHGTVGDTWEKPR